jgi:hypothetical protein
MTRLLPLLTLFALLAPLQAASWDELRGLRSGETVKVMDTAGKEYRGTFRSVSPESITIQTEQGEQAIGRRQVRRVRVRSSSRRIRNLLIGAAVGVAIGATIDQTLGVYFRNESNQTAAARAVTYIAPIGIFGGIGAALPGYRTIYKNR